jgi:acid phosphatase type 7
MRGIRRAFHSRAARVITATTVLWWGFVGVPSAEASEAVLVGAGDIAECKSWNDSATAAVINSIGGKVFTLGDNAYEAGTDKEFYKCYGRTWGKFKNRTRPAVGNHEYHAKDANGYFDYFRGAAGARGRGWYSYKAGAWRVIVLNSNCNKVGCGKGSQQERWLRAELARHDNKCTLAYFHHSRFSSDKHHGNSPEVGAFWDALYDYGAELVLSGHAHSYERFAPQTPWGKADPSHGIRQIVVGTGGSSLYRLGSPRANSQVRNASTFGVLKLKLKSDGYDWNFIPVAGKSFKDSGKGSCHGRP